MSEKLPLSKSKKKVHKVPSDDVSIKPNGNLIESKMLKTTILPPMIRNNFNDQDKESASPAVIPVNLENPFSSPVAIQQVRVCVTKEEGINSYESEYLENISESTQSIDYDSTQTDPSFSRHIIEGALIRPKPLEIFHEGIIFSKEPAVSSVAEFVSVRTLDEQKLQDLLMQKEKPQFGDFEAVPSYRLILEKQKLARETILSKLDEFFLADESDLILKMQVQKKEYIPLLSVQFIKPIQTEDAASSIQEGPLKIQESADSIQSKLMCIKNKEGVQGITHSPKMDEHWRCHMHRISGHRNDLSSTTSGTSIQTEQSVSSCYQTDSISFVTGSTNFVDTCEISSNKEVSSAAENAKKHVGVASMAVSAFSYMLSLIQLDYNCCRRKNSTIKNAFGESQSKK